VLPSTATAAPSLEHARWFHEEVQPYEEKLRAYLRHRFPTIRDVDDIVQETYARLFRAFIRGGTTTEQGEVLIELFFVD